MQRMVSGLPIRRPARIGMPLSRQNAVPTLRPAPGGAGHRRRQTEPVLGPGRHPVQPRVSNQACPRPRPSTDWTPPSRLEPAGQRQIRRGRGAPTQYPGACPSRSSCARRPGPHPTSSSLPASRCSVLLPCRPLSLTCSGKSVSTHGSQLPGGWRTDTSATGTETGSVRGGRYGQGGRRVLWQRQRG
jgi:hypothetical protein